MATEEPEFKTILKVGKIEIREYAPKIIAQVEVFGDFDDASSKGFKILADYIFRAFCNNLALMSMCPFSRPD